jgi:hypothetical protein
VSARTALLLFGAAQEKKHVEKPEKIEAKTMTSQT